MALPTMTVTTGANFIPEIWSSEVLRAVESNLVLADKVKRYDSDVKSFGDTIHVPNLSNLSANPKVADTAVTPQAVTEGKIDIAIDKHYETSFYVEDILKVQSKYDLMSEYTSKAGYAIAKQIDLSLAGLYSGLSQYVGNGSTDVTDENLVLAVEKIDTADAPESDRYFVIKPSAKAALMLLDKFVLRTGPGWGPENSPILHGAKENGFWGDIYGFKVYVSNNLVTAAGTPTVVHNLMFQKEAFGLAMQQSPRTQTQYKQEYLANLVTVDTIYGLAEMRDTFAVDFRSKE
jgi:N4-gp56 family major capsid protein